MKYNNLLKLKNNIKFGEIQTTKLQKTARVILWIFICFLIIRGIASIVRPSQQKKIIADVTKTVEENSKSIAVINEASSFAESFAIEYLTYNENQLEDYRKRLSNYMVQNTLVMLPSQLVSSVEALSAIAISSKEYSENSLDIDVKVKIKYSKKNLLKDIYLRVPVGVKDGKYIVEDSPFYIAKPQLANIETKLYDGNLVEAAVYSTISDMLTNFFKVYFQGNSTEIKYYLSDTNNKIEGLGGVFKFKSIDNLNVYDKKEDKYLGIVTISLIDSEIGQEIRQKVRVELVKKDNRYYIENLDVRTVNLKE